MPPIRKGDGTPVTPKGISQIRTGDGRILFDGVDTPDSVVLQYFATAVSGGETTWPDDNNVQNMTLSGGESDATLSDSSQALGFDGDGDHGTFPMPSELDGNNIQEFSVEFAVQYSHTDQNELFGILNNDGTQFIRARTNVDGGNNTDNGNLNFDLRDSNDNRIQMDLNASNLNDGNRHDISIIVNDSTTNDVDVIIDGSASTPNFVTSDGPNSFDAWDHDMAISARNSQGTIDLNLQSDIGAIRWHETGINEQTISEYP